MSISFKEKLSFKLDPIDTERKPAKPALKLTAAAVIPAYNEERRIPAVLNALVGVEELSEIIVVSDGSTDRTCEVAASMPRVRAVQLQNNHGKGGAMLAGARMTNADVLVFFDADLTGLTSEHVRMLLEPVQTGEYDMATGVLIGGRWATDIAQKYSPNITGQRSIRRDVFLKVPHVDNVGYGIELAINYFVWHNGYTWTRVMLKGISHPMKEEKLGWIRGTISRSRMYWQMLCFRISYELHGRPPKNSIRKPPITGEIEEVND